MAWINEAAWPVAWLPDSNIGIYFSPIVKSGSDYICYCIGYDVLVIYKYDITTQAWTYLNTTPAQLFGAMAMSPNGAKLCAHGINDNHLYIYDIAGNSWTTSAAAPILNPTGEAVRIGGMGWADNDTIWCQINDMSGNNRQKAYKYVVSTDTWSQGVNYGAGGDQSALQLSFNTAKTALFFGKYTTPRNNGIKYVIATDTYSTFACGADNAYDFAWCSPQNSPIMMLIDALTSYTGYAKFDCDTETFINSPVVFPDDMPYRDHGSQYLPIGLYKTNYIIAYHHKAAEPHDRSYYLPPPASVGGLNPALVELLTGV